MGISRGTRAGMYTTSACADVKQQVPVRTEHRIRRFCSVRDFISFYIFLFSRMIVEIIIIYNIILRECLSRTRDDSKSAQDRVRAGLMAAVAAAVRRSPGYDDRFARRPARGGGGDDPRKRNWPYMCRATRGRGVRSRNRYTCAHIIRRTRPSKEVVIFYERVVNPLPPSVSSEGLLRSGSRSANPPGRYGISST